MLKQFLALYFFLSSWHQTHAQLYPFNVFNTTNGLVNNRCGNISQDSAGYIWVGTDNGICNYDGRKFNFFPGQFSTYYFAHSQPNMYKGYCLLGASNGGLAKCAGNKVEFIVPSQKNRGHVISGLAIDDSTYLIAKLQPVNKLLLISGKTEKEIAVPEIVDKDNTGLLLLFRDNENNIWAGSSTGVVIYIKGNLDKPYIMPALTGKYNNCIKEDFEHNVFVSSGGCVYKIPKDELKKIEQSKPHLFYQSDEHITTFGFLHNGDILLAHMLEGIKIFSKGLKWKKDISGTNGLYNIVWDIFVDRENNIWLATDNDLLKLKDIDFVYYKTLSKNLTNITSGVFYNDNFVFSNGREIVMLDNEKAYLIDENKGNLKPMLGAMLVAPGNELWTNAYYKKGVSGYLHSTCSYDIKKHESIRKKNIQTDYSLSSPVDNSQYAYPSKEEMLFLTEAGEPYWYSKNTVKKIYPWDKNVPSVFSLMAKESTRDDLWLLSEGKGLLHCRLFFQNDTAWFSLIQAIPMPTDIPAKGRVILLTKDKTILLGTGNNGILLYKETAGKQYALSKHITVPHISSVMITALLQDSAGNIWAGTNNGIDKMSWVNDTSFNISKGMFENALTGRMIYFLKQRNEQLYIGTTSSLAIADIKTAKVGVPPLVNINHLTVNNRNADSLLSEQGIVFDPGENNISFEFVALSFINEKQTAYQYKLEGTDTGWSIPTVNYTITYVQLKPGSYTFRVKAKNADGTWSAQDAVFSFKIKKPFYQHWAFFILCTGIACAFLYWLYRIKITKLMAVEKTRQYIGKDLHDDIGSTLSSITLMNAVLKNKIEKKPDEAIKLAEKIEDTSRQMIQNMSDIVWSINPGNDTMDKLQNRLQQFCADVFEDTETVHKLTFSDALIKKSLPMQLRRDIYLICKEITNNAAKYSSAKSYILTLTIEKKNIFIEAIDDGIGFDITKTPGGNGLNNIRQRVAVNNGETLLYTEKGTCWSIKIPFE